ncbi:DNA-binding protein [Rhodopirellula europaea]|uniref:DNA-binding protein n=1 Tax=Rhodopirellula europaea TaxID=1263866 RepID=UPI003D2E6AB5|tara:strand:+ start:34582 stop:34887 length:306 start_codon:yes stop_codon:yes gene_type:complete
MPPELLSTHDAAVRLGISPLTLYDWLSQSDAGNFVIRGKDTTIHYFQGGRKGQGRIKIAESEVHRLLSLMAASPRKPRTKKNPLPKRSLQHITAKPGRPED